MATVGLGLPHTAYAFFDALRQYDVERALEHLDDDASWQDPEGKVQGKDAIRERLAGWLTDPERRPSITVSDVQVNGPFVHYDVSVSGRLGRWPQSMRLSLLLVRGLIEQAVLRPL